MVAGFTTVRNLGLMVYTAGFMLDVDLAKAAGSDRGGDSGPSLEGWPRRLTRGSWRRLASACSPDGES